MKMKNKRAEQDLKRKEHKAALAQAKRRRRAEPLLERAEPEKNEKQRILIVCEGKNTEPSYFKKFKLATAEIKALGKGNNTVSLVNSAYQLSQKEKFDQVWCVFDKDSFPASNFNNAIIIAKSHNFGVAYSNQAFEYWLILHFEDHQGGAMDRRDYAKKLNGYLAPYSVKYSTSSKLITNEIFDILLSQSEIESKTRQELAIERAERNMKHFDNTNPAIEESSTRVHELVKELLKFQ